MMHANSYNEITGEMERGCKLAAERLGEKEADVQGYFLAGDEWQAQTAEELADEICEAWEEQARQL